MKSLAAVDMESKDERSRGRKWTSAEGTAFLTSSTAASPFEGVRAAR